MAVALAGVVLTLLVAALLLLSSVVASHRARTAADLAALAAALHPQAACAEARRIAERHGAALGECSIDGDEVELTVAVRPAGAAARLGTATARARAGPDPLRSDRQDDEAEEVDVSGGSRSGP